MLNENTRVALEQLAGINDTMILSYPITSVVMNEHFQAFINLSVLNEGRFDEFAVYSFLELNQVISIIEDAVVTKEGIFLVAKNENTEIRYATTPVNMVEDEARGDYDLIEDTRKTQKIASFDVSTDILNKVKKAAKVFSNLTNLKISNGENGEVSLTVTSNETSRNDYHINTIGEVPDDFNLYVIIDLIDKIPSGNYTVDVYNTDDGTKLIFCADIPGLEIILNSK